jgi:hypothetical protein
LKLPKPPVCCGVEKRLEVPNPVLGAACVPKGFCAAGVPKADPVAGVPKVEVPKPGDAVLAAPNALLPVAAGVPKALVAPEPIVDMPKPGVLPMPPNGEGAGAGVAAVPKPVPVPPNKPELAVPVPKPPVACGVVWPNPVVVAVPPVPKAGVVDPKAAE